MNEEDELIQTFIEEATENFQVIEEGLLDLESSPDDDDLVNGLFRAMHTIKGSAGLVGLEYYSEVAHHLENVLDKVRKHEQEADAEVFSILFKGTDILKQMMENGDYYGESFQDELEDLQNQIKVFSEGGSKGEGKAGETSDSGQKEQSEGQPGDQQEADYDLFHQETFDSDDVFYLVQLKFDQDFFESGVDLLMWFVEMEERGQVVDSYIDTSNLPPLNKLNPDLLYISWLVILKTHQSVDEVGEMFTFISNKENLIIEDITDEIDYWLDSSKNLKELMEERGLSAAGSSSEQSGQVEDSQQQVEANKAASSDSTASAAPTAEKQKKDAQASDQRRAREKEQANTIRVDASKLENILNNVAELLIAQSRVKDLVNKETSQVSFDVEIYNAFDEVDKIIRYLQEEVMKASMVPIGGTLVKFQRMARDLAHELGKEMEMVITGRETELDKRVIEQITDPLKHLIRNTLDHGLEMPEDREAVGKSRVGTIGLNAFHQEGNIVIEITDDGRGIDKEKILAKAKEKGIPEADYYDVEDDKVYSLLFHPGFSTAEKVTDLSGRGVGMDVVQRNIQNLRGSVEIESEKGKGSKFIVKLPLTLAIIDGMVIRLGEERLVVPLNSISEFLKVEEGDLRRAEGKGLILSLRDEYIPYVALCDLLGLEAEYTEYTEGIVVVLKDGNRKIAILVDEIISQEQVVIKNVKEHMEHVEGIAGATILGDGRVAIILDVASLFRLTKSYKGKVLN